VQVTLFEQGSRSAATAGVQRPENRVAYMEWPLLTETDSTRPPMARQPTAI
jgi:hypothetical protein